MEGSGLEPAVDHVAVDEKVRLSSTTMNDLNGTCVIDTGTDPSGTAGGEEERAGTPGRGAGGRTGYICIRRFAGEADGARLKHPGL